MDLSQETEAASVCGFPTIDRPNQKTTQEIALTVPAIAALRAEELVAEKMPTEQDRLLENGSSAFIVFSWGGRLVIER